MEKMNQKKYRELLEKRANLQNELEQIAQVAEEEQRAMTEEERQEFDRIEGEVRAMDETIKRVKRARDTEFQNAAETEEERAEEEQRAEDERVFEAYLRNSKTEQRAGELTMTDNGAVVPASIGKRIIQEIVDICPIWQMAERYNVPGSLSIPYYDEAEQKITMAYANEFVELESKSGKFRSIDLTGYLAGALSLISRSLMNNAAFPIVDFVVTQIAKAAALFVEGELLNGTDGKVTGLKTAKQKVTCASAAVITADDLIDVQEEVRDQFQTGAIWIMNRKTRTAIRKLKNEQGEYLLNRDLNAKWGYTLLGKDVYTTDAMPVIGAGKRVIYYGDMSGLALKVTEDVTVDVLREKYATQHAVGVVAWIEFDAKIQEEQKLAALEMGA